MTVPAQLLATKGSKGHEELEELLFVGLSGRAALPAAGTARRPGSAPPDPNLMPSFESFDVFEFFVASGSTGRPA